MKFQYCSDLHLELPKNRDWLSTNPIIPSAPILLLAGDIIPFNQIKEADSFFNYCSKNWKQTYWVPGNHEYYGSDINCKPFSSYESIRHNVSLINNDHIIRTGFDKEIFLLIFSTLWSYISISNSYTIEQNINDYNLIENNDHLLLAQDTTFIFNESRKFIEQTLLRNNKYHYKTVVITHHIPTFLNYPSKYKGDIHNEAFATELYDLIEKYQPNYWLYGHHHSNIPEFNIGKTKLITNQLGYVPGRIGFEINDIIDFKTDKIFEI